MKKLNYAILFSVVILILSASLSAQTRKRNPRNTAPPTAPPDSEKIHSDEPAATKNPTKKNERPTEGNEANDARSGKFVPIYFYEFSQPNFLVSKVLIEHDENGKGKIIFKKRDSDEIISDPLELSTAALERIKILWNALNFLDSAEVYQSADKDYGHLGNLKLTVKKDGRERTAKFNWTENKEAKALTDEYRKIGNQFVWMFDVGVSRENQPLETPRILDRLDSLVKLGEISDAEQMIPFLKQLSNDERIPLIARNHATRIVQQIEKQTAKKH